MACLLTVEFCFAIVSVGLFRDVWNFILSIALSTTNFGCLFVVFSDILLKVPKERSSCSGTIDFRQNSRAFSGHELLYYGNDFRKMFLWLTSVDSLLLTCKEVQIQNISCKAEEVDWESECHNQSNRW